MPPALPREEDSPTIRGAATDGGQALGNDHIVRCGWAGSDPLYIAYHDQEWGVPLHDERALFEMLILEGFQAGLSWITILRKRDNFRRAFDRFVPARIAAYDAPRSRRSWPIRASCAIAPRSKAPSYRPAPISI